MTPRLKPPTRARRVPAFARAGRAALTNEAIETLFAGAEVLSEGGLDESDRWYGSIMITFDLARVVARCRDLETDEALARLVTAIEGSVRVRVRAHRMTCGEIYRRYPDRRVSTAHIESAFRREGMRLLLDVDVEVSIEQARASEGHA